MAGLRRSVRPESDPHRPRGDEPKMKKPRRYTARLDRGRAPGNAGRSPLRLRHRSHPRAAAAEPANGRFIDRVYFGCFLFGRSSVLRRSMRPNAFPIIVRSGRFSFCITRLVTDGRGAGSDVPPRAETLMRGFRPRAGLTSIEFPGETRVCAPDCIRNLLCVPRNIQ